MKQQVSIIVIIILGVGLGFNLTSDKLDDQKILSGKDHALFFAVNSYQNMRDLNNPIQNAYDIAKILKGSYGFSTEIVENPTLVQIEDKLAEYKNKFIENAGGRYPSEGQLFIFFTGHGSEEFNEGYFLPSDAKQDLIRRTGLPYNYWRKFINSISCKHILVAVDACHSVTFDPNWQSKTDFIFKRPGELSEDKKLLQNHVKTQARLFFTSDGKGDQTPDKSDFAKKFQEALLQKGNRDDILTSTDIFAILKRASPTPHGGDFGDDQPGSSFLFIQKNLPVTEKERIAYSEAVLCGTTPCYKQFYETFPRSKFIQRSLIDFSESLPNEYVYSTTATRKKGGKESPQKRKGFCGILYLLLLLM